MQTDPILGLSHASRQHADLIRCAERERDAATVHPWYRPLASTIATARVSCGGLIIRFGQFIQGADRTSRPALATN